MTQSKFGKTDKIFPVNPFPDVEPTDFNKLNKKRVTEDWVSENFEAVGWKVFEPFTDSGIDRIITKRVCPNGHTAPNLSEEKCSTCGALTIDILRFIQVKTRALKNGIFGFTLKSKDIRIDPRHTFVFYSDSTQDLLIVPVFQYLKFFEDIQNNPFAPTSFRKGNNKLNSLQYNQQRDTWYWGKHSWAKFRNLSGLMMLQDPKIDIDLLTWIKKTREISNKLLLKFHSGGSYPVSIAPIVNKELENRKRIFSDKSAAVREQSKYLAYLREKIKDQSLLDSIMKYWETIKNLEIAGEEREDE